MATADNIGPDYMKVVRWIAANQLAAAGERLDGKNVKYRRFLRDAENAGYVKYDSSRGWYLTQAGRERVRIAEAPTPRTT